MILQLERRLARRTRDGENKSGDNKVDFGEKEEDIYIGGPIFILGEFVYECGLPYIIVLNNSY